MTETELLQDCLGRLNACGLPYFLTGSMASNYWGVPRSTHDLDFVVQLRSEDVPVLPPERMTMALHSRSLRLALTGAFQALNEDNLRPPLKLKCDSPHMLSNACNSTSISPGVL